MYRHPVRSARIGCGFRCNSCDQDLSEELLGNNSLMCPRPECRSPLATCDQCGLCCCIFDIYCMRCINPLGDRNLSPIHENDIHRDFDTAPCKSCGACCSINANFRPTCSEKWPEPDVELAHHPNDNIPRTAPVPTPSSDLAVINISQSIFESGSILPSHGRFRQARELSDYIRYTFERIVGKSPHSVPSTKMPNRSTPLSAVCLTFRRR